VTEALTASPAPLVWRGPVVVGREAELARVLAHLEADEARMVGVASGPSFGKTLFLAELESAARERGWLTARRDPAKGQLTISSGTTEEELMEQVRSLLGLPGAAEGDRMGRSRGAVPPARLLVEDLVKHGRCLLLIDDFRPGEVVRGWLTARFAPELRRAKLPVVAVVAGLPDAIEALGPLWDEVVELGPLPEAAVRAHFEAVGALCRPPLSEAEIDAYVEDSLEKPHVLNALTMLLAQLNAEPGATA